MANTEGFFLKIARLIDENCARMATSIRKNTEERI